MTLIEALLAMLVIGVMALTIALTFKTSMTAYTKTTAEDVILVNARIAAFGSGIFPGINPDIRWAKGLTTLSTNTLTLTSYDGSSDFYSIDANTNLVANRGGYTTTPATDISSFTPTYFARTWNYQLVTTTDPTKAVFVALYSEVSTSSKTVSFYTGARLRNP